MATLRQWQHCGTTAHNVALQCCSDGNAVVMATLRCYNSQRWAVAHDATNSCHGNAASSHCDNNVVLQRWQVVLRCSAAMVNAAA